MIHEFFFFEYQQPAAAGATTILPQINEAGLFVEMRTILKGSTDQSVVIRIVDSADGTPETGVVAATSGLDLKYRREGGTTANLTESDLSALNDAHADGGLLHIGGGYYRVDVPDAAFASGANGVLVFGTVTGMVVIGCYVELVDFPLAGQSAIDLKDFADDGYDPATNKVQGVVLTDTVTTYTGNTPQTGDSFAIVNSGTHGNAAIKGFVDDIGVAGAGLTALGDTRIANLDATVSSRMETYVQPTGFLAATFPTTVASTTNITAGTITTVTNLTNAPTNGDLTATMKASVNTEVDTALADVGLTTTITGRIDAAISTRATPAQVATELATYDGPTHAELTSGLAAADDATLAAISTMQGNVTTILAAIDTEIATLVTSVGAGLNTLVVDVKAKTDLIPASPAAVGSAMTLTSAYDFSKGTVAMTESYRSVGTAPTPVQLMFEVLAGLLDHSISGTTKTIRNIAGTAAKSYTLDSAVTPTSITEAT